MSELFAMNRGEFTIAWICAVQVERVAAGAFLDEQYKSLEDQPANDNNSYKLGRIGKHNVVIAVLPDGQYGLVSAGNVVRDLVRTFPNIRVSLMVGVGGGVPSKTNDIRLGDVVVSRPTGNNGGVFQYDYGKTIQDKDFTITGHLNQPPLCLLTAIANLKSEYEPHGHTIKDMIEDILKRTPRLRKRYQQPAADTDRLYQAAYKHQAEQDDCVDSCNDASELIDRSPRGDDEDNPVIHFGTIASANQLMKDALMRDELAAKNGILCFEMEAAGIMNQFPCLVIRGICDYSDTHKNKNWQGYAAMTAAAYAKDLINTLLPSQVAAEKTILATLSLSLYPSTDRKIPSN